MNDEDSVPAKLALRFAPGRHSLAAGLAALLLTASVSPAAQAGRGGSAQAIASAISSGSSDAIKAELERAEHLVCAACVDYVLPLIDAEDVGIREVAAWWLARRGTARRVYADMLTRLGQPDSVKARNAADVLGQLHRSDAIPPLGAALSNPLFDSPARVAMARALGTLRRPAAAAPLWAVVHDPDPRVRAAVLSAVRKLGDTGNAGVTPDAGTAVLPLLADPDEGVRIQAIFTVAEWQTTAAAPALVKVLTTDTSSGARKRAAWALGRIRAPASVAGPALKRAATSDSSPLVRSLAALAQAGLAH